MPQEFLLQKEIQKKSCFSLIFPMDFSLPGPFRHRKPISSICSTWISLCPGCLGTEDRFPAFVQKTGFQHLFYINQDGLWGTNEYKAASVPIRPDSGENLW